MASDRLTYFLPKCFIALHFAAKGCRYLRPLRVSLGNLSVLVPLLVVDVSADHRTQ